MALTKYSDYPYLSSSPNQSTLPGNVCVRSVIAGQTAQAQGIKPFLATLVLCFHGNWLAIVKSRRKLRLSD